MKFLLSIKKLCQFWKFLKFNPWEIQYIICISCVFSPKTWNWNTKSRCPVLKMKVLCWPNHLPRLFRYTLLLSFFVDCEDLKDFVLKMSYFQFLTKKYSYEVLSQKFSKQEGTSVTKRRYVRPKICLSKSDRNNVM